MDARQEARQARSALGLAVVAFVMAVALCSACVLTGCGGGDDDEPRDCVVDGKHLPPEECK
jgi:hypothetical protein